MAPLLQMDQQGRTQRSKRRLWTSGCGSKLNRRGYAGFGPCFHLPGFHVGTVFLSHSQVRNPKWNSLTSWLELGPQQIYIYIYTYIYIYIYAWLVKNTGTPKKQKTTKRGANSGEDFLWLLQDPLTPGSACSSGAKAQRASPLRRCAPSRMHRAPRGGGVFAGQKRGPWLLLTPCKK